MSGYYAHRSLDGGRLQTIKTHLENTAERAKAFGKAFDSEKEAYYEGYLHDIGKYSQAFQDRLLRDGPICDHSTAGAQIAYKDRDVPAAFTIAGHHVGLPDGGSATDSEHSPTLLGRMKKDVDDYSSEKEELTHPKPGNIPQWIRETPKENRNYAESFYIRMLFSCLVDADYLDTEAFMKDREIKRGMNVPLSELEKRFASFVSRSGWSTPKNELGRVRYRIVRECQEAASKKPGIYSLTVPTGGGKTGASFAFALRHAVVNSLERIIYVIPYTSIIEQNAEVFRKMVGSEVVLEHHCNADFQSETEDSTDSSLERKRLSAENWDASVIVTTSVQFFESLYSAHPSKCRKLHNIARSVIIFDEAQMLPVNYLEPCMAAVSELVEHYGCTALLCTATQPSLAPIISKYSQKNIEEIAHLSSDEREMFKRVIFRREEGTLTNPEIALHLNEEPQVLCIVNSRRDAQEVYEGLDPSGRYHLSTFMTPVEREKTIKVIKERLASGKTCRVVSTSLIEAGVDVDFPSVWRAEAGLDSVLQAAGRCNREGKRERQGSIVHVYKPATRQPTIFKQNIAAADDAIRMHPEIDSQEAMTSYFDLLYLVKGTLDQKGIIGQVRDGSEGSIFPFRTIDEEFQMIDSPTMTIYIPNDENRANIMKLRRGEISRYLLRALARHSVQVYPNHFMKLRAAGAIDVIDDDIGILLDEDLYSPDTGLAGEPEEGKGLFI